MHMEVSVLATRLLISAFIGSLLGLERELKNKSAGFITITLVCLGATIVALIQEELLLKQLDLIAKNSDAIGIIKIDVTRLSAQVISGVGFIGGGSIIYTKDKVLGITTAAILWVAACIGLAIGYGFIYLTVGSIFLVLVILVGMKIFEKKVIYKYKEKDNNK
ncbi:MAG: MgtC/SapB family protein [Fusobacteriaceae bacterium]